MRILLNVDEGKYWHAVARLVGQFARETGSHVTVVSTQWSASSRAEAFEKAARLLELPPSQRAAVGRPGLVENVLPDEARRGHYDLVVVGRLRSLDWLTNGLIASLLVRRISTSVLVVRGHLPRIDRVLVTTEGPRHGGVNFRFARLLAKPLGARVTALYVMPQMPLTYAGEEALSDAQQHFLERDSPEARHLAELTRVFESGEVRGEVKVRVGPVVEEILHEIHEGRHDLLVLGGHQHEDAGEGLLYENIASLLVRGSPISFLVVREPPGG